MSFKKTVYDLKSSKIKTEITFALISDLHDGVHGEGNSLLLEECRKAEPDMCLCPGDMIVAKRERTENAAAFLKKLRDIAPVVISEGNHESYLKIYDGRFYERYIDDIASYDGRYPVSFLDNGYLDIDIRGNGLRITGLSLPLYYYRKLRKTRLSGDDLGKIMPSPDQNRYNIMLAHNPVYGRRYLESGYDLTVSGHIHGGMIRVGKQALLSPDGFPLPRYGYGHFRKGSSDLIVGSGLGDHAIPFRLFDPFELVIIRIGPA